MRAGLAIAWALVALVGCGGKSSLSELDGDDADDRGGRGGRSSGGSAGSKAVGGSAGRAEAGGVGGGVFPGSGGSVGVGASGGASPSGGSGNRGGFAGFGGGAAAPGGGTAGSIGVGGLIGAGGFGAGAGGLGGSWAGQGGVSGAAGTGVGGMGGVANGGSGGDPVVCAATRFGGAVLDEQSDLEAMRGVFRLEGDLVVSGDVQDLSALGCLRELQGSLRVIGTSQLETLAGLDALRYVSATVFVGQDCGEAFCSGNRSLRNLDALSQLEYVGDIRISGVCLEDEDQCSANEALERIVFERLLSVSWIAIAGNPALTEVRFDALEAVVALSAGDNPALRRLDFPSLEAVQDSLQLVRDPSLEDLTGFPKLEKAFLLEVGHVNLTSLLGLENFTYASAVYLHDAPRLVDVSALSRLSVLQDLWIEETALADLSGLDGLTIATRVSLVENRALRSLDSLQNLRAMGELELTGLDSLEGLDGLPALSTLNYLRLDSCPLVTDVDVLSGRTALERLTLSNNPALMSLDGLSQVESMGELYVDNNAELSSLHAFAALTRVRDHFIVKNNPKLPACEVDWLYHRIQPESLTGRVEMTGNDGAGECAP